MARAAEEAIQLKVMPWNGHKAAVSLTFDDGDDSHLDVAVPELNKRKMAGTFYLIVNKIPRKEEWRKILDQGHEIGNHSLDHLHAQDLNASQEESQVVGAKKVLQKTFGVPVETFCYPYSEVTPGLKKWAGKEHLLVRGGGNDRFFMSPGQEPDWADIHSEVTLTRLPFSTYQAWMDEDLKTGSWFVFMIHGLENSKAWEPIPRKMFVQILDYLQSKDFWVDSFLRVGAYFRAEKIFEKSRMEDGNGEKKWQWELPAHFPDRVFLKVRPEGASGATLLQGHNKLSPDAQGLYSVLFNQGELTLMFSPAK